MPESHPTRDRRAPAGRLSTLLDKRPLLLALGVLVLVFLVALGSSRSLAHTGGPGDLTHAQIVIGNLIILLVALVVFPASAYILWTHLFLRDKEPGEPGGERERRRLLTYINVLLPVALTLVALWLLTHLKLPKRKPIPQTRSGRRPPLPSRSNAGAEKTAAAIAPWLLVGFAVVCILVAATVLILRRRRVDVETPESELELRRQDLRELLEGSLDEIEREPDPRRAVIRAYVGMESTLARHDLARRPSEAPDEYLARALAAVRLSRRASERLTRLFERARFSEQAIGGETKREAIAALAEVRDELEVKPA